jgi:hypothetical protein
LIVLSCQNNNQKESVPVNFGMVDVNSSEFVDILREYHKQYLAKERSGVITIDFQIKNDISIFFVSSIVNKALVKKRLSGYYSIVDEFPVLFYTGIEKNLTFDSLYIANLYKVTNPFMEEYLDDEDVSIIQVRPNYNPVVWKIEMISQKIFKTTALN